ncbi:VWA domain-containing protein [Photobacterium sp. TY1-4]|uniref:VWA domain-containing protein n=1 Tax=Photobacterium sp. TY1-4 TaxID=2899122 RepID=UPI0021BFD3A8|nr:VWA domain-containing protein [Photobacterium sp. TY1-4]UXI04549.1 VWA domain-containing protein [Photobacterium sp. TY1-4]
MLGASLSLTCPHWLWLLPLPLLIHWLVPAYRTRRTATKVPFFQLLIDALGEPPTQGAMQLQPRPWQRLILIIAWGMTLLALTKPTLLGEPQTREKIGRDLMVVLDLSGSMAETDFSTPEGQQITRLDAAKHVLTDFVAERTGDRLGLILFGDAAFVQTPFTADLQAWQTLLDQTEVAMAGESTALGDAIGLAIKVFEDTPVDSTLPDPERQKVAIVLTDGNDTGSFVAPVDAAKVAAAKSVRIHVIAMGDPDTVGEQAMDMTIINRIARATGGQAFQAMDSQALQQAYDAINTLEPQLYESTTYRPKVSLHHALIIAVLLMYLVAFSFATYRRLRQANVAPEER